MANLFEGSKVGAYGNQMQMFGLSSKMDTQAMLEASLQLINIRNQPTYTLKTDLEKEKTSWNALKSSLNDFQKLVQSVKDFDISNKEVKFSSEGFASAVATKDAVNGSYDLEVSQLATSQRVMGDQMADGPLNLTETIQLNGKDISLTADMTLRDVAFKINQSGAGTGAIVLDNKLVLTSEKTGTAGEMAFTGAAWQTMGVTTATGTPKNEMQTAQDAAYKINGVPLTSSSNTINDVEGIEIQLSRETTAPVKFEINRTSEEMTTKLKDMVNGYNKMINNLNTIAGEEALFQGERIPRNIKSRMSETIYQIQGAGTYLFEAGIELDGAAKNGTIKFDETKFKEFFDADPEKAMDAISGTNGLSSKLDAVINKFASATGEITGETKTIDSRIKLLDQRIERFEMDFERQKQVLIKKYAMFEVSMSQLNSQNDYLMSQLGQFEMDSK